MSKRRDLEEVKARKKVLGKMKGESREDMHKGKKGMMKRMKPMHEVSIMAPDQKSLKKAVSVAEKLLSHKGLMAKDGGRKYAGGGIGSFGDALTEEEKDMKYGAVRPGGMSQKSFDKSHAAGEPKKKSATDEDKKKTGEKLSKQIGEIGKGFNEAQKTGTPKLRDANKAIPKPEFGPSKMSDLASKIMEGYKSKKSKPDDEENEYKDGGYKQSKGVKEAHKSLLKKAEEVVPKKDKFEFSDKNKDLIKDLSKKKKRK